jgi:hypothetical protein
MMMRRARSTSANAPVEELPGIPTLRTWMNVGDERFDNDAIRQLYESSDQPLRRATQYEILRQSFGRRLSTIGLQPIRGVVSQSVQSRIFHPRRRFAVKRSHVWWLDLLAQEVGRIGRSMLRPISVRVMCADGALVARTQHWAGMCPEWLRRSVMLSPSIPLTGWQNGCAGATRRSSRWP